MPARHLLRCLKPHHEFGDCRVFFVGIVSAHPQARAANDHALSFDLAIGWEEASTELELRFLSASGECTKRTRTLDDYCRLLGDKNLVRTLIVVQLARVDPVPVVVHVFPKSHDSTSGITGQVGFGCAILPTIPIVGE